jgi:hypothetical protein
MQYVLKSKSQRACALMLQTLLTRGIHAEMEPLIEQPRGWGLAVAEEDAAAAKHVHRHIQLEES